MTTKPQFISIKVAIYLLVPIAVIILSVFFWNNYSLNYNKIQQAKHTKPDDHVSFLASKPTAQALTKKIGTKNKALIEIPILINETEDIPWLEHESTQWKRTRGYFKKPDYDLYASYDHDTLRQLAREGDLLALDIWAKILKKQKRSIHFLKTQIFAATHGSTKALTDIVNSYQARSWQSNISEHGKHEHIKTMLIYAEMAAMRNDFNGILTSLMEMNQKNIVLSANDLKEITAAAEESYANLEKQRLNLGLNEFENDISSLEVMQMSYMISALPNPNGWATSYLTKLPSMVKVDNTQQIIK